MNYWLIKSEPSEFSIDDLKRVKREPWDGVRNYQARNMMRDQMKKGDLAFFYHSNCNTPGIAGIVEIIRAGYPDPSQFDVDDRYYDERSNETEPRWFSFDVQWKAAFATFVSLSSLKANARLDSMKVVQRGQRLSIQPVTGAEWREVCRMGGIEPPG